MVSTWPDDAVIPDPKKGHDMLAGILPLWLKNPKNAEMKKLYEQFGLTEAEIYKSPVQDPAKHE